MSYTDADVELVAQWFSRWFGASSVRTRDREYALEVLSALAAAGRLTPTADATAGVAALAGYEAGRADVAIDIPEETPNGR